MGVKVNQCDIVPPISSGGGGAPVGAPYLLNGPDVSGTLTSAVDVLALATPQPFVATAPFIGGQLGAPVMMDYANGAGSVGDGVILPARLQNDGNTQFIASAIQTEIVDATAGTETTKVKIQPATAGSIVDGIEITRDAITFPGARTKSIVGEQSITIDAPAVALEGAGSHVVLDASGPAIDIRSTGPIDIEANGAGVVLTLTGGDRILLQSGAGGNGVQVLAGNVSTWTFMDSAVNGGALTAIGSTRKVANIAPGTTTGDAVAYQQVLLGAVAAPTNGGPAVNATPGACMIAPAEFTAPTGGSGTFLLKNNTGANILIVGARVLIPSAGATTLACSVSSPLTTLFDAAAIVAPSGTHLSATATYSIANATIANGANITIAAEGSVATVDTIIFVEYIQL